MYFHVYVENTHILRKGLRLAQVIIFPPHKLLNNIFFNGESKN